MDRMEALRHRLDEALEIWTMAEQADPDLRETAVGLALSGRIAGMRVALRTTANAAAPAVSPTPAAAPRAEDQPAPGPDAPEAAEPASTPEKRPLSPAALEARRANAEKMRAAMAAKREAAKAAHLSDIPAEEIEEARQMMRGGKIGARGLSDYFGWSLEKAQAVAATIRAEPDAEADAA